MKNNILFLPLIILLFIITGCQNSQNEPSEIEFTLPDSGIDIADAWARPGRENGVTAVYMHVLNGSVDTDTLLSITSPVSGLVELHETYDRGDGMMGMRKAEDPIFPGRDVVTMQPGGLHVMLMQLSEALNEGDEVSVTLHFALAGDTTVLAPVRSPNE